MNIGNHFLLMQIARGGLGSVTDHTKKKYKKKLYAIPRYLLILFVLIFISSFVYQRKFHKKMVHCGEVVKRYEATESTGGKNSSWEHNYYLDVHFTDNHFESVNVTTDAYYKNAVGSTVCFTRKVKDDIDFFLLFIGFTGMFCSSMWLLWIAIDNNFEGA